MNRYHWLVWFTFFSCLPMTSAAVLGASEDFRGVLWDPMGSDFTHTFPTKNFWGRQDEIKITLSLQLIEFQYNVFRGVAWVVTELPGANVQVYTLYGVDLNPMGDDLHITGVSAQQASGMLFHDEVQFGASGTSYPGISLGTPTLAQLPAVLPFATPFIEGDPNSLVYVFRTNVPSTDYPVPEMPTIGMFSVCGGALIALRRRSR
jgi:hypothetical protein